MDASFFALGPIEILFMLALSGSGQSVDLVSLAPTHDYFKSRGIEMTVPKMLELAAERPKDGKGQFVQLMALRYLAEETDGKKAEPAQIKTLEEIAEGKIAFDGPGFAKVYAARVLARWNNTKAPAEAVKLSRDDAFDAFPAEVDLIGMLDPRHGGGAAPTAKLPTLEMFKKLNQGQKDQVFDFVESIGNVQLDRISFGYSSKERQFFVRFTGKFQTRWVADKLAKDAGLTKEIIPSGKDEEDVYVLTTKDRGAPVFALVDGTLCGTDVFVVGHERFDADHKSLLKTALDVRAGKKPSVLKRDLKAELKKVSDKAIGFIVGEVPEALQQEGKRGIGAMPKKVIATLERGDKAMDLKVEGFLDNADDAKTFVAAVSKGRDEALAMLKNFPPDLAPGFNPKQLTGVLEGLQIEAKDGTAKLRVQVPHEVVRTFPMMFFGMRMGGATPPIEDPKEDKKESPKTLPKKSRTAA